MAWDAPGDAAVAPASVSGGSSHLPGQQSGLEEPRAMTLGRGPGTVGPSLGVLQGLPFTALPW